MEIKHEIRGVEITIASETPVDVIEAKKYIYIQHGMERDEL